MGDRLGTLDAAGNWHFVSVLQLIHEFSQLWDQNKGLESRNWAFIQHFIAKSAPNYTISAPKWPKTCPKMGQKTGQKRVENGSKTGRKTSGKCWDLFAKCTPFALLWRPLDSCRVGVCNKLIQALQLIHDLSQLWAPKRGFESSSNK